MKARGALGPLALALLGGCISLAPTAQVPDVVEAIPAAWPEGEAAAEYRPAAWWHGFEDPVLNALVEKALAGNLDIAQAAARADRAAAQARVARAGLLPTIDASLGANYSETPISGGSFSNIPGAPSRLTNETYSLGLAAAYEVDLFGRVRNDLAAARADAVAARHDLQAARLAIAAEVISAYFDIVDARAQIATTLATLDVLDERSARTEERFRRGLVQSFELYQLRQDLRSTQASLPLREIALTNAEARLALLLGEYPEELRDALAQPLTPRLVFDPVPAGLPADLLAQRPDVAARWERLEAARLRIGARRAERFPALRLNASTGTQGSSPADVLDVGQNWLLSLGAGLAAPIFDNGRISANIAAARASHDEAAAAYGASVLGAYGEATAAIAAYEEQRQRYRLIAAQSAEARASLEVQAERYGAGVGDYIAYLDALRAAWQVDSALSAAARDVALARLGVHRALAGGWFVEDDGGVMPDSERDDGR